MIVEETGCGWGRPKLGGREGEELGILKAVERPLEEQALLIKEFLVQLKDELIFNNNQIHDI